MISGKEFFMKNGWKTIIVLICLMVFGFTACSSMKSNEAANVGSSKDLAYTQEGEADRSLAPTEDGGATAQEPRKVIFTANARLQVDNPKEVYDAIVSDVKAQKGYISYSQQSEREHGIIIHVTVRIPSSKLEAFLLSLQNYGKVLNQEIGSEEITKQYFDTKARLDNAIKQKDQYEKILLKAEKIEDILAVQREIDAVQERIEMHRGQIELWDQLVDFSTATIELIPNPRVIEGQKKSAWNPLGWKQMWSAFSLRAVQVANAIVHLFQWIFVNLIMLILLALVGWIIIVLLRKNRGKKGVK
jgi:hypothetical protein